jgi:hypothetical protein
MQRGCQKRFGQNFHFLKIDIQPQIWAYKPYILQGLTKNLQEVINCIWGYANTPATGSVGKVKMRN